MFLFVCTALVGLKLEIYDRLVLITTSDLQSLTGTVPLVQVFPKTISGVSSSLQSFAAAQRISELNTVSPLSYRGAELVTSQFKLQ